MFNTITFFILTQDESSNPMAVFNLSDTEETRKMWNFRHVSWITLEYNYLKIPDFESQF